MNNKPMLNAYPDSLGGKLSDIAALLKKKEMQDTFSSFYILPSLYHSDLDRGFSVVDYNLNVGACDNRGFIAIEGAGD